MSDIRLRLAPWIIALLLVPWVTPAHAATFGFTQITSNGSLDITSQLSLDVTAVGSDVRFTFSNALGGVSSSIAQVYFAIPGTLSHGPILISDTPPNVDFVTPAIPGNLPGGSFAANYSAGADNPRPVKGINPGETLAIDFQNTNFSSALAAIFAETLEIGIHVQAIFSPNRGDTSESYILAATPLPGALPLFATGLASLGLLRRWRKRRNFATG